jgi:hypothetical protein
MAAPTSLFLHTRVSGYQNDGVCSARPHPGQVAEVGFCVCPNMVVGRSPSRFPAEGIEEHHNKSPNVYHAMEDCGRSYEHCGKVMR